MKVTSHLRLRTLLALPLSLVASAASIQSSAGEEVARLESIWAAAELRRDTATIGKLLADDFTMVTPAGAILTRVEVLQHIASNTSDRSGSNSEYQPRVYGSTVVITGLYTGTFKTAAGSVTRQFRWTDTWVRSPSGEWNCVAAQATSYRTAPPEPAPPLAGTLGTPPSPRDAGTYAHRGVRVAVVVRSLP